jgi:hypothetical protein
MGVFIIMTISFALQFFGACWWIYHIRKERAGLRKALWRHKWRIWLWVMLVVLFYVRWFWLKVTSPQSFYASGPYVNVRPLWRAPHFLPLLPYILLFMALIVKSLWRRQAHMRRRDSEKDWSHRV